MSPKIDATEREQDLAAELKAREPLVMDGQFDWGYRAGHDAATARAKERIAELLNPTRQQRDDKPRWRTGTKVGNTLYRNDVFVGSCVTAEIAAELVRAAQAEPVKE